MVEGPTGYSGHSQKAQFTPAGFIFQQPAQSKSIAVGHVWGLAWLCQLRSSPGLTS